MPNQTLEDLREQLAAIEHERWCDWQRWCHQVLRQELPAEYLSKLNDVLDRWDRQIITRYDELTDQEKASDMEQVDRYWPLIQDYAQSMVVEELEKLKPPTEFTEYAKLAGSNYCVICGFNGVAFGKHIQDRIAAIKSQGSKEDGNG